MSSSSSRGSECQSSKSNGKRMLLLEPTLEEEELSRSSSRSLCEKRLKGPSNVSGELTDTFNNKTRTPNNNKSRPAHKLNSLLNLLFAALSLSLFASCLLSLPGALAQAQNASSTVSNASLPETSTISVLPTSFGDSSSDELDVSDDSDSDSNVEQPELALTQPPPGLNPKIMMDTSKDAVDLLLKRLGTTSALPEPDNDTTTESSSGDEEEESPTDSDQSSELITKDPINSPVNTTASKWEQHERQLKLAMETYTNWKETGAEMIELVSKKLLPAMVELGYEVDAGTVTGLLQVFNGLRAFKPWSLKLLDASAKLSAGILVGTQADFGDYEECLNVRTDDPAGLATAADLEVEPDPETGLRPTSLVGRYCVADIEFPKPPRTPLAKTGDPDLNDLAHYAAIELNKPLLNFSETAAFRDTIFVETANFFHMLYVDPLRAGICLTNRIEPEHFASLFNKLIEHFRVRIDFKGRCVTKYDRPRWTIQQKVSGWILCIASCLVIISSLLDVAHMKLGKLPLPSSLDEWQLRLRQSLAPHRALFTSFSILRNTKRLFKPKSKSRTETMARSSTSSSLSHQQLFSAISSSTPTYLTSDSSSSSETSPSTPRRTSLNGSAIVLIANADFSQSSDEFAKSPMQPGKQLLLNRLVEPNALASAIGNENPNRDQVNLLCLHGIRVITMTWMIVNHTYLFGGFFVIWAHRRLIDIAEWPKSVSFQLVLNGWLTVETYFFLSALIIVLNVLPLMKSSKFSYPLYIIHRLIRLMPAYLGIVCLNFLWPLVSSGPVWMVKGRSFIQEPCENYLWTNFLFINNWIWPEKQCMVHTWFLSADFQLYLLAPIVVYLLYKRPVLGHTVNIIVAIIASIFSGFIIYANELLPSVLINKLEFDAIKQQLSYSYFATYQHMGPYCLGLFTGYLLNKHNKISLPKHLTWLLWLILPPLSFTTLLLTYLWNGAYNEPSLLNPSPMVSAIYVAIHRTIWTSLVAWIVFACATNRAKLLTSFLSHSLFVPLSRLSFSIYLVHLPVIMFRALNLRHTLEWTDSNILWEACGNLVVSIIVGYLVNVTFESPIINLEYVLFGRKPAKIGDGKRNDSSEFPSRSVAASSHERNELKPRMAKSIKSINENDLDDNNSSDSKESPDKPLGQPMVEPSEQLISRSDSSISYSKSEQAWTGRESNSSYPAENQVDIQSKANLDDPKKSRINQLRGELFMSRISNLSESEPVKERGTNGLSSIRTNGHFRRLSMNNRRPSQYSSLNRTHQRTGKSDFESEARLQANFLISQSNLSYRGEHNEVWQHRGRPARYNTLSGTRSNEWGHNYLKSANWPESHPESESRKLQAREFMSEWLPKPGLVLPRIDSSTLRRPTRNDTTGSIVEEPTLEERTDM